MRIDLGGVAIGYEDGGRGRPLLLFHAFPLDRRMWAPLARELPSARVIAIDQRGLGESAGAGSLDDVADDGAALLDRLGVERAVVGGLSMGGYAALSFARRHRDRLAGLLLADTRAGADTTDGRKARDEAIARLRREGPAGYVADFVPKLVARTDGEALATARDIAVQQSAAGLTAALAAMRDRADHFALLPSLSVPATVVVGSEDRLTPPEEARRMASAIPGARLVEIAGAGHLTALEAPRDLAAAVAALLARAFPG